MSILTPIYHLIKPSLTDVADITAFNANWDTIDGMLGVAKSFQTVDITSGTDLNTCTDMKFYRCKTNAIASTLSNSPTANAFSLIILPHTSNGLCQIVTEYMTSGAKQFRRNMYNNAWGDWITIATGTDLDSLEERLDYAKYDDADPKQEIKATYIKDVTVNGTTMTLTKGNGTKATRNLRDTTYSVATPDSAGLMSAADKAKLDRLSENSNGFEIKSYTGNGQHGSSHPNSITFSFEPKQVVWLNVGVRNVSYGAGNNLVNMSLLTTSYVEGNAPFMVSSHSSYYFHPFAKKSSDGKTLYWYVTVDNCSVDEHKSSGQLNADNTQYVVMAIK